ncbi:pilus assembly protein PilP [Vogesella sp. LIG4]|uniref:pilus assembly protein PilP n=1 Tax=Vogesella sp. LIG4 TaxID=1192162 RepID=UPI00081F8095|nr:pilus assembly protein PilP [Vogesella sp. LIG4]SCK15186.1 type IV pilus assembly protein PilP [Vogesella sp. LIG4]
MKLILSLLIGLLLAGCGYRSNDDIEQWMQQAGKGIKGTIEPIPPMTAYIPAEYQGQSLVPPFNTDRLQIAKKSSQNMPDLQRTRDLLENYDLDKLKLVGTVQRKQGRIGLIRTPDVGIQQIRVGSFIGPNFGIVRSISETEVRLEETVENINGEWVKQDNHLLLQAEQGKTP